MLEALRPRAVFALDTALRLERGRGFFSGGDVFAYLESEAPLAGLAERKLIAPSPFRDDVLVRAWPGPPRLMVRVVDSFPESRLLESGYRVVSRSRLRSERIESVGARPDLFALVEGD